jgi:hypothetical protein
LVYCTTILTTLFGGIWCTIRYSTTLGVFTPTTGLACLRSWYRELYQYQSCWYRLSSK